METFSERLEYLIKELNINKSTLANRLGVTKQVLNKWFNHGVIPEGKLLLLFNAIFNISIDWLLTGKGSMYAGSDKQKDYIIKDLQSELIVKDEQLSRIRNAIGLEENKYTRVKATENIASVKLVKDNSKSNKMKK